MSCEPPVLLKHNMEKYSKNISGIFHVLTIQSLPSNSFIGSKVISSSDTGKMSLILKDEDAPLDLQTLHATHLNNSMSLKYGNYIDVPIYTYISLYTSIELKIYIWPKFKN